MSIARRRRNPRGSMLTVDGTPSVCLWTPRLLVTLNGHREFINQRALSNDTFTHVLSLQEWIDPESRDFNPKAFPLDLRSSPDWRGELHDATTNPGLRETWSGCQS